MKIIDTNHLHPNGTFTTVLTQKGDPATFTPPQIWTVIGTPDGPDLVIDPNGRIHTFDWGGSSGGGIPGDHSANARAVYDFVNQECFA